MVDWQAKIGIFILAAGYRACMHVLGEIDFCTINRSRYGAKLTHTGCTDGIIIILSIFINVFTPSSSSYGGCVNYETSSASGSATLCDDYFCNCSCAASVGAVYASCPTSKISRTCFDLCFMTGTSTYGHSFDLRNNAVSCTVNESTVSQCPPGPTSVDRYGHYFYIYRANAITFMRNNASSCIGSGTNGRYGLIFEYTPKLDADYCTACHNVDGALLFIDITSSPLDPILSYWNLINNSNNPSTLSSYPYLVYLYSAYTHHFASCVFSHNNYTAFKGGSGTPVTADSFFCHNVFTQPAEHCSQINSLTHTCNIFSVFYTQVRVKEKG